MNTDSYFEYLSDEKLQSAADAVLKKFNSDPSHSVEFYASASLRESFCPCLFQECPYCTTPSRNHSVIEDALINEITSRVSRTMCTGNK